MDERGNIDLIFRNGLKDYEVLPPQDVWEKIQPSVKKKSYLFLLRYAAAVLIVMSLGFLVWSLSHDVTTEIPYSYAILDISQAQPIRVAELYQPDTEPGNSPAQSQTMDFIPQKAEYSSSITVMNEAAFRTGIISGRASIILGPEKAEISSVPQNVSIESTSFGFPEYYSGERPVEKRWSISAMATPTYYSKTGTGNEDYLRMIATENAATSYSGGVGLSYKISKRFSIQTGFYYSAYGQEIGGVNSFSGFSSYSGAKGRSAFEVITSNGPVRTSSNDVFLADAQSGKVISAFNTDGFDPVKANLSPENSSLIQSFNYIQMPVLIRYKLIDRNIDFNLLGGVSYDFLVGNSAFTKTSNGKMPVGNTEGLNSLLFSSSLGMGLEYNFSEKVSLNFEPTFRYFVNPFNDAAGTRVHPYSFGVFSGISYKF